MAYLSMAAHGIIAKVVDYLCWNTASSDTDTFMETSLADQMASFREHMHQEVKNQFSEVSDGLKELYTVANIAVGAVATRVTEIEESLAEQRSRGGGAM